MRRLTVLSLPPSVVFPDLDIHDLHFHLKAKGTLFSTESKPVGQNGHHERGDQREVQLGPHHRGIWTRNLVRKLFGSSLSV
jgi:hypothetical protein